MVQVVGSPFGSRIREWRRVRRLSQLELAGRSGTTTRHLSFLKTGRSRPSATMVLRLCEVLEVPLRQRNELLESAGLAAQYPHRPFESEDLAPYRVGLERLMAAHDPFPGLVLDAHWRVLLANEGGRRLFGAGMVGANLVEWMLSDGPTVLNQTEMAAIAVERLRAQARERPTDRVLVELVAATERRLGPLASPSHDLVVCPTFVVDGEQISVVGMAARFEAPAEVTVAELRDELFFPADPDSEAFFRRP